MGRKLRSNLPGVPFHLTTRVQGHEPLFIGLEPAIVQMIQRAEAHSDARVIAHAVMPNHLHLVVIQGERPLERLMQPLLRRVALLTSREKKKEGHIFERRFRDSPCLTAEYLRNAIAYVHLNAVRAQISQNADDYPWSSHVALCALDTTTPRKQAWLETVLRMFSTKHGQHLDECRARYRAFLNWRLECDRIRYDESPLLLQRPDRPDHLAGDAHWVTSFGAACVRVQVAPHYLPDLSHLLRQTLVDNAPEMSPERVRSGEGGRDVVRIRRKVIGVAIASGYRTGAVARYLNISDATVSKVARSDSD